MPTVTLQTRVPRQQLVGELRKLPGYLSGRLTDQRNLSGHFNSTFVHSLFGKIQKAFKDKSNPGGRDEFGDSWAPLKPSTIAQRPLRKGEATRLGIRGLGRAGRGLLTAAENRKWKGIFASTFARLAPVLGEAAAKAQAARLAWAILKSQGAKTKLATLGTRSVPLLVVSGRLKRSLGPGTLSAGRYSPPDEQIAKFNGNRLEIGTSVPYAGHVHKKRRLWPTIRKMQPWFAQSAQTAVQRVLDIIAKQ